MPMDVPISLPYSIPLLGSSLVRTSTSFSSRPLSSALCLVHLRPTGASHPLFVSESLRPMLSRSSISLGLLLSRWPLLVLGRSTSLA